MSIFISQEACVGCRRCVEACPGNLIKLDADGKAYIRHPKDCWGCTSCVKECGREAISFFLGADMGGRGSRLTTHTEGDFRYWKITDAAGQEQTIVVNQKDANRY